MTRWPLSRGMRPPSLTIPPSFGRNLLTWQALRVIFATNKWEGLLLINIGYVRHMFGIPKGFGKN